MRADARKNYEQLLAVARLAVTKDGADASLRDIARKAGVGLGTLYRHFPTREALLETLLRTAWDELAAKAHELETASAPDEALVSWLRDFIASVRTYRGVVAVMMSALNDKESALYASCAEMRASGTRLLARAQAEGTARTDIDGTDLIALAGALAWIGDQPAIESRAERLFDVVMSAVRECPATDEHCKQRGK
ncbi:TetR family transcriptional regulator [Pleomorphomonas carboxyditropha]|uniref:TetR family transcriptional regulator n=2 Tax=Pleomorphomonas TaxID=261933 RepID=A0A2G9WRW0_9HYPH|nr:TetR family transcriptional regulator [Pleomorphomonas carboxyditropha]